MFGEASAPEPATAPAAPAGNDGGHDEDAMFGGEEATEASAAPTTTSSQTSPASSPSSSPSSSPTSSPASSTAGGGLLADAAEALTLGGQLFLRANASFRENTAANDATVTAPSLLDAFADVRPNDRVRGFAQLRFTFDPTIVAGEANAFGITQKPFDLQLAQAWTKFDLGRVAYVTLGRQRIRWGTGRFWNPTDFINQEIRNSVDFFDQRVGVDLVKVHFPFEQLGWNLYLISAFGGISTLADAGTAARAEFVVGDAELALSAFVKQNAPLRFGADASAGVGLFDVKGEAILSRGLSQRLFRGELDFDKGTFPEEVDTDDEWYFQGVAGVEASFKYTDTDTLAIGGEYFYNQAGYDSAELYPFLFVNSAFVPLYTGQHYAAAYAFAQGPFDWDEINITVSTLANLSDLSCLSRLDIQFIVLQYLTINTFVAGHWGRVGEFKLGIDIPANPLVPALVNGFTLENEAVDAGFAARINF
jgi:hypothetical protein